jgi:hypothetical protein
MNKRLEVPPSAGSLSAVWGRELFRKHINSMGNRIIDVRTDYKGNHPD